MPTNFDHPNRAAERPSFFGNFVFRTFTFAFTFAFGFGFGFFAKSLFF